MSSNDSNNTSHKETRNSRGFFKTFSYYFDVFYDVTKGIVVMLVTLFLILGALVGGGVVGYFASLVKDTPIPTHAEMETQVYDYDKKSTLYFADNSEITDLRSDLLRTPVPLEQISQLIINAIIATEDENFYEHEGIVPKALIRAGIQEVMNAPLVTGGSTITQQLIKQQILSAEVTHSRKAVEILYATHLENSFNKEDILEAYMNISPFGRNNLGRNIAGVEEAAQGIFGVSASEVSLPQAAFLAGLPKSPISYSPYLQDGTIKEDLSEGLNRQAEVLYSMFREGYITEEVYRSARDYDITTDFLVPSDDDLNRASRSYVYDLIENEARDLFMRHFMKTDGLSDERIEEIMLGDELLTDLTSNEVAAAYRANQIVKNSYYDEADTEMRNGGYDIYSTIDPVIHNAVEQRVSEIQDSFGTTQIVPTTNNEGETINVEYPVQISGSLIENETGRVIAFIGGRDYEFSNHNRAFDSRRQTGSTIKPLIVYGPALEENFITPATIIPDTRLLVPHQVTEEHEIFNVGRTTNDWGDARRWLAVSQNIPNTKIYLAMQDNNIDLAGYIRSMGLGPDAIADNEFFNASTSLGGHSGGPTPTELAGAYAMIGNNGQYNDPYVIERIVNSNGEVFYQKEVDPVQVWGEDTNYILFDMLRDVTETSAGTGATIPGLLNFDVDLAAKTGTTDDSADVWFAGTTPKITLTTWLGYDLSSFKLQWENGIPPYIRNLRNWANIMNAVYSVKPEVLGIGESVQPPADGSVTTSTVLRETGMKAGNVSIPGGRTVSIEGSTKSEIFKRENIPGRTTYDFAIGAKPEEVRNYWSGYLDELEEAEERERERERESEEEDESEDSGDSEESSESDSSEDSNVDEENESEDNSEEEDN